ncbi:hypothetical protein A9P82_10145 [Arachidicoccus ginsenosidimutans]|uniref:RagB/SusD family nutrient uptake outer membrane protein n=1 Tax=Arachidicoccus sp. BS20 TaxID=1850526 RepID=UPI0007F0F641|nr:RagB/SusD family nutrient uptake outer membrane protein [Arachidicoccus sp. BS20]ANI90727.1 hypothetical protein A9P82_10145 [Arachidicoccus sp. BS20]
MKNLSILILFVLVLCASFAGCSKDFLTEHPKDAIYADNLYVNYDGFRLAVNALLDFPRQEREVVNASTVSLEAGAIWKDGTDIGWANSELSFSRGLNRYNVDLNPQAALITGVFNWLYKVITASNMIISRAQNSGVDWQGGSPAGDDSLKNLILAHAHLIRAWAYRHLVYTYGAVPIDTTEINGLTYRNDWNRDPVSDVQNLIISDLTFAEQYLPDNSNDVLVLSRAIAQHYLADMYLWKGENDKAEEEALKVVNNSHYKLVTERYGVKKDQPGCAFMDQFYSGNILPSQGNTEGLWVFPNSDVIDYKGASGNAMRYTWLVDYSSYAPYSPEYGGRGINRLSVTPWALSIYEPQDDRGSQYALRKYYVNTNGDTTYTQSDVAHMVANNKKWESTCKWDWTYADPSLWNASYSYSDQTYLRLSDTYLLLAEAEMKLGKLDEAADWINKVRERSHASPVTASQVTLDFILDERSRELVTEEERRETLVRTGTLVQRVKAHNPTAAAGIQDYNVLLPIPQNVIDANTGKVMDQNPGY